MFYKIICSLFFISLIYMNTFSTALGDCKLEIFGGKIDDIPEIVHLVKKETRKL